MAEYRGPATIVHTGGEAPVECAYRVEQDVPGGLTSWRGEFSGAPIETEPLTGAATLRLPSGAEGQIVITYASLGTGSGSFTGSGPPPALG